MKPISDIVECVARAIDATHEKFLDPTPADMSRAAIAEVGSWIEHNSVHASDCAVHNAPALPQGLCNCGATTSALEAIMKGDGK